MTGPFNLTDLMEIYAKGQSSEARDLYDEPFVPKVPSRLQDASTMFEAIAQGDIVLHQPYESFERGRFHRGSCRRSERAGDEGDAVSTRETH